MLYTNKHLLMQLAFVMGGGWVIFRICGKPFTIEHSLSCSFGGFPTIRHNKLHDVTANLLSQVCSNVQVEPQLQPMPGETLSHCTSNADEHARLDISTKGFWNTSHERVVFDSIL